MTVWKLYLLITGKEGLQNIIRYVILGFLFTLFITLSLLPLILFHAELKVWVEPGADCLLVIRP